MEEKFIGIDPSLTGTGFHTYDNCLLIVSNNKFSDVERIQYIVDSIALKIEKIFLEGHKPIVGIEGFSFMSKGRAISQLFGLGWAIRLWLHNNNIEYYEIPPHSWKKFLFKNKLKKGAKDLIILETYKKYGVEFDDNNICDAFNIMKFTESLYKLKYGIPVELSKDDMKVLDKVIKCQEQSG